MSDKMKKDPNCGLCDVIWRPTSSDVWGPSVTSLQQMSIKTESHVFKPFKEAAEEYVNK